MNHEDWLKLMQFPAEWTAWGLLPKELSDVQLAGYQLGHEDASEHDRHGAFQWWLKRDPSPEVLIKLAHLAWLDPDPQMGRSVRKAISEHHPCNELVKHALITPYVRA